MPRGGQESNIERMKRKTLEQRGGDPNKRGNPENPNRYQLPKQAKGKTNDVNDNYA